MSNEKKTADVASDTPEDDKKTRQSQSVSKKPKEIGGRDGPEPTRYGDWEKNGLISDF